MANNIRGITIEIGGDTSKLGKALESSEKKSRSLNTELRQIQQSLKFNPANVELLTQKQTVLTSSIEETSEKLDVLKEAERQVIAQFERGEVAEEQVRALQREIIKTENQLDSMTSELQSTNTQLDNIANGADNAEKHTKEYKEALADAEQELEDFKSSASEAFDVLATGAVAVGTATVAVATYATTLADEFDKASNTLQTQTGATVEEMAELNDSMERIYTNNLGESMEDVATAMAEVKQQTDLSGQALEEVTSYALLMRDVFGFEVNESIRGANSLMDQFGITAEEAYTLIAQGAQNGLNQNGDLMDVVNEYAVQFSEAGYSAEDMFNMLVNGADEGTWSIDKLGDAVKEYNIRMSDGTAIEYLEQLGLNADEITAKYAEGGTSAQEATNTIIQALQGVENEQDRYIIGQGIMGTMWEDLGEDAIYSLLNTQGAISQTSDALDQINEIKYDDLGSALEGLKRSLETEVINPIGEDLKPVVEEAISYVQDNGPAIKEILLDIAEAIGDFVNLIVDNGDYLIATVSGIAGGLLLWNVVTMIQGVVGAIQAFKLANEGATIAQWALNVAMDANPIGIIITLVGGLILAIVSFIASNEEAQAVLVDVWNKIVEIFWGIVDFFQNNWQSLLLLILNPFAGVFSLLYNNFDGFRNFVDGVIASISGFFVNLWNKIVEIFTSIKETVGGIVSAITGFFTNLWTTIVTIFSPAIEWFSALFSSIYETLSSMIAVAIALIQGIWTTIVTIFSIAYEWFNTTVIIPISTAFSNFWTSLTLFASNTWESIKAIFIVVATWYYDTVISPIITYFSDMWANLKSGASGAWEGIKNVFSTVTSWFRTQFNNAWTAVKNVFSTGGRIFTGITEGIISAFTTVVNGIIGGINTVVAVPFNAINGVLNTLRNASIAGVSPFSGLPSISVPQIPLLYRGGILEKGQVGLLEGNGAEAVVPLEKETGWINRIAQKMNDLQRDDSALVNGALMSKMDEVIQTMKDVKSTIVLDTGVLVGETINQIDEQLGYNYSLRERRV